MSAMRLVCDQAIFTSLRSAMGEGYRVVSASRGLKTDERQHVTRYSPSHDALCPAPGVVPCERHPISVSFYPLPTGRLCVACSCFAGEEHTGRGGQRVYTASVAFDPSHFAACGFSPFRIARAMSAAGLLLPQLKPDALIEEVTLVLDEGAFQGGNETSATDPAPALDATAPPAIVERLLENRSTLLNTAGDPLVSAEWILAGVPGPMRAALPFSAGMRYSVGRVFRLQVVFDEKHACREKVRGKQIEYVDAIGPTVTGSRVKPAVPSPGGAAMDRLPAPSRDARKDGAWLAMVSRCWSSRDLPKLLARTSRPFSDTTPPARERVGRLYRDMDSLPGLQPVAVLDRVEPHLNNDAAGAENEIVAEFLHAAERAIREQLLNLSADALSAALRRLTGIAVRGTRGPLLAAPLVRDALRHLTRQDVVRAMEALLELRSSPAWNRLTDAATLGSDVTAAMAESLARLAPTGVSSLATAPEGPVLEPTRLRNLHRRLTAAFPDDAGVKGCTEHLERLATACTPVTSA